MRGLTVRQKMRAEELLRARLSYRAVATVINLDYGCHVNPGQIRYYSRQLGVGSGELDMTRSGNPGLGDSVRPRELPLDRDRIEALNGELEAADRDCARLEEENRRLRAKESPSELARLRREVEKANSDADGAWRRVDELGGYTREPLEGVAA